MADRVEHDCCHVAMLEKPEEGESVVSWEYIEFTNKETAEKVLEFLNREEPVQEEPSPVFAILINHATQVQVQWGSCDPTRGTLTEGGRYEVERIEIRSWHTKIHLKDFPGKVFNSASFIYDPSDAWEKARAEWAQGL